MARITKALRALDVSVKLIPDIDVLNDENIFKAIVEAFDIEWEEIRTLYNTIVGNLHSKRERISAYDVKNCVDRICSKSANEYLSDKEIKEIKESISIDSKWDGIKKSGIYGLPSGQATIAYKELECILRKSGIYIVPEGELECFIKEVGNHGPEWVNNVLEKYPNLDDEVYRKISEFIKMVCP